MNEELTYNKVCVWHVRPFVYFCHLWAGLTYTDSQSYHLYVV